MFFQPTGFSCEKSLLLSDAKLVLNLTCLHTSTCNETKLTKSSPRAEEKRQFFSTIDMSPHVSESKTAGWDSGFRYLSVESGFLTP